MTSFDPHKNVWKLAIKGVNMVGLKERREGRIDVFELLMLCCLATFVEI